MKPVTIGGQMDMESPYRPRNVKERLFMRVARSVIWAERKWPNVFGESEDVEVDSYASAMTSEFNWLHGFIYPRFFKKINIEASNLEEIQELSKTATIIYVTKDIGQLEYNFFNYLFHLYHLPLARFVNELSLWQWLPLSQLKNIAMARAHRFAEYGPLPHPIASGYVGALVERGDAVFVQLKSTAIFNDLYWYTPKQDPLAALLAGFARSQKQVYVVPLYFLWNKRPDGTGGSILDIFPSRIGKVVRFWRNYKNRAVVKIGQPLLLSGLVLDSEENTITDRARSLRKDLLDILQQEKKIITGPALKPRSWMIDELLQDDPLQKVVYDVSLQGKGSIDTAKALAKKYANEIATDINYNYVEVACRIMRWALRNIYDGIVIDQEGLSSLKKAMAKAPVVLVPNHRSHMDYLLLSTILYENSIAIPHVAAGLNLSFWPMGHIFRRCGAFFIRRSFAGNELYRAVFKTYLKIILKEGYCQEFFIEGSRSRTGKLLRPKTGMLTMITEAMQEGASKELSFVPVSITYDHVIEEYKNELEGEAKQNERTRDLLKLGKHFRRKYGKIYLRFGEPVAFTPDTKSLSSSIMVSLNREMVVTGAAVAAVAILASTKRGITNETISANAEEFLKYLKWKGTAFANISIPEAVQKFVHSKYLELHDEFEPTCFEIKDSARINLDYYKNNIVHFFVSASCLASILVAHIRKENVRPSHDDVKGSFLFCKDLFSHEFAFSTRMEVDEHIKRSLDYFKDANVATLELYKGLTTNFFESYLVALLSVEDADMIEEKVLLKTMMKFGKHMLLLGQITKPEALSTAVFKNAIQSFVAKGILRQETDPKGRKFFSANPDKTAIEKLKLKLEGLS